MIVGNSIEMMIIAKYLKDHLQDIARKELLIILMQLIHQKEKKAQLIDRYIETRIKILEDSLFFIKKLWMTIDQDKIQETRNPKAKFHSSLLLDSKTNSLNKNKNTTKIIQTISIAFYQTILSNKEAHNRESD